MTKSVSPRRLREWKIEGYPQPGRVVGELHLSLKLPREGVDELQTELTDHPSSVGFVTANEAGIIEMNGSRELPVALVQSYINDQPAMDVDYIHGWDTSLQLGKRAGSVVLVLPEFNPRLLYPTVSKRGVLPRKAFSLGEAEEKRYYLEARRIS